MSTGTRQRTNCQACGARCRASVLEVQIHGGHGWNGHWRYSVLRLCPPCRQAQLDFWFKPGRGHSSGSAAELTSPSSSRS